MQQDDRVKENAYPAVITFANGEKMKAAVFDLDGTLLNTLGDIASACNYVLANIGRPTHPFEAYAHMVGNGFETLMKRAVGKPEPGNLPELVQAAREWYANHMMEKTEPYSGMTDALLKLAENGARLSVLSNKPEELSVILIEHYFPDIPFIKIIGAKPGKPLKPDPSVLLELLKEINVASARTFYIGDSNVDMQTAKAAGCIAIGCAWGFRGSRELQAAGADRVLQEPGELGMLRSYPV